MLALDVSESMSRDDVAPTRIQAAKTAARDFLGDVPSDVAVGLVVFAGTAQTLAQPTTRRTVVEEAFVGLPRGEGTVIGDGLDTSLDDISQAWAANGHGPAAVVLLSDGRDTGSATSPESAAQRARVLGIPVYTVVLAPTTSGEAAQNIDLMSSVARTSGGEEFTATTANGLIDVYRTIQDRLTTALAITDFGAWFVGAAGTLAVAATIALLLAIRAENAPARARTPPPARRDVPRSRRPRTDRGRAARPRR
jgi:Ca-activated chloride channel family protein